MSTAPVVPEQEEAAAPAKLTDEGRKGLESLCNSFLKEEMTSRRAEVRKAWQQQNFKNGFQYLWWDQNSNCYMQPSASGQELPRYMDVYNIYTPHWRSFVSILSQNPPGVNFVPDDLQRSTDVTAAAYGEKMRHRVDRLVHMKDRQSEVASTFCTDGRTMTWTRVDSKGKLRVTVHGVLETKVPIFARKMENWGYADISEEVDVWEAKEEYSSYADDITAGEGTASETSYERFARLGILANRRGAGGDAETLKNLVTKHTVWIRPARYRKASDTLQKEYKALYPDGVRVTMISGKAVECVPEVIEQALRCEWPAPGKGSSRPSLLHDLVPICEAFNDAMNMLRQHFDFSIPATWVTDTVDSEALTEQRSAPGVIHQITIPAGASINDLILQEQVAQLPSELVQNIDRLLSLAQFTTGDLPSLYGDGTPDQETASGQKMLSDQAKGQLSPAWGGVQWLFAGTYEIAVILAAKMLGDRDSISISGGSTGQQQFNPAAILDGVFGCYPNTDSSFPETMADQRASLQAVISQLSQGGEQGLAITFHPDNLKLFKQYSGLENLVIPQAEARDKQLREIEQLLQEPPVPDEAKMPQYLAAVAANPANAGAEEAYKTEELRAVLAGTPPPPKPQPVGVDGQPIQMPMKSSIDVGKRDFHQYELDKGIEWLSSTACFEEIQKGNQPGIDNVNLHLDQHEAALAKIAQENAPKPEPPKISLSVKVDDPTSVSQILALAGVTTDPETIEAANIPEEQNTAADTQHKAAQAQHQGVLAAREAVTPIIRKAPDMAGIKEK